MLAAAEEAKKKNLSIVAGLVSRYDAANRETIGRIHDGAIGEITAVQSCYLRAPYRLVERRPEDNEIQSQYRNWYHFTWLSGDDVPQTLVHNLDRVAWALGEATPVKAHGLGGRSASFGPVFGTKGRCHLLQHRIAGETNWRYEGPRGNGYEEEHRALFAAIRDGKPVNDGPTMAHSTMICVLGQIACYTGQEVAWDQALHASFAFGRQEHGFALDPPVKPQPDGQYPVAVPGITRLL